MPYQRSVTTCADLSTATNANIATTPSAISAANAAAWARNWSATSPDRRQPTGW